MLGLLVLAPCATVLGIAYVWGADPSGSAMQTGYILTAFCSFVGFLFSEDRSFVQPTTYRRPRR